MNHNEIDENLTQPPLFLARLQFAIKNYVIPIVLTGLFLLWVIVDWLSGWHVGDSIKERWNADLDQVVSLATLMIALFVWYGEIAEDWKNNLPKRLTVRFETVDENNEPELAMLCIKAHLSDAADIRNLGQQIGRQMNDGKDIPFCAPYIKRDAGEILYSPETGHFQHYTVIFTISQIPDGLSSGQYKLWKAPFKAGGWQIRELPQEVFRAEQL